MKQTDVKLESYCGEAVGCDIGSKWILSGNYIYLKWQRYGMKWILTTSN